MLKKKRKKKENENDWKLDALMNTFVIFTLDNYTITTLVEEEYPDTVENPVWLY
jgi:hypothetical protein